LGERVGLVVGGGGDARRRRRRRRARAHPNIKKYDSPALIVGVVRHPVCGCPPRCCCSGVEPALLCEREREPRHQGGRRQRRKKGLSLRARVLWGSGRVVVGWVVVVGVVVAVMAVGCEGGGLGVEEAR
jgi:hypothetical protein